MSLHYLGKHEPQKLCLNVKKLKRVHGAERFGVDSFLAQSEKRGTERVKGLVEIREEHTLLTDTVAITITYDHTEPYKQLPLLVILSEFSTCKVCHRSTGP